MDHATKPPQPDQRFRSGNEKCDEYLKQEQKMSEMRKKIGAAAALALLSGLAAQASDPVLFDFNTSRGAGYIEADYADFQDWGISENIIGADVMNALVGNGSQLNYSNETTGITIVSSGNVSTYSGGSTLNNVLREYVYNGTTITVSNLNANLDDGDYALYVGGVGDKAGQNSIITFNGEALTTSSSASPTADAASNFVVRFEFTKTGEDSISFDASDKFNGFAIVSTSAPGPDLTTAITPEDGATYVTNLPTIEVVVTEGELTIDETSFTMALVSGGVTNDVSTEVGVVGPSGGEATFSYTPAVEDRLDNGTEYTVLYSVAGVGGELVDYSSAFTTAPDLHSGTTPLDGAQYVATNGEVSVTFTNVAVNLSGLHTGHEMIVNSNDVTGDVVISYPTNGVMKFEYAHSGLETGADYDVQLNVFRSDAVTNTVDFSFSSALDPSLYLIGPGIRNGGFELVDGVEGNASQIAISTGRVDDWGDDTGAGAKTEAIDNPTEGTRSLVTGGGSETYNITETAINAGDIFEFAWTIPARANGVSVGLAYDNGSSIVTVSNSLVYTSGATGEFSGSYLFSEGDAAVGYPVGIIVIDDNVGSGAVYVDEVRLYYGNIAVQSVSPADGSTSVAADEPIEVVIAEAASQVDTNSIVLTVNSVDVTADAVISDTASGVTITYTPAENWVGGTQFITVSADGLPEGTASQSWSFGVDAAGTYLISPDLRNGSFELVGGVQGSGTTNDWDAIDFWSDDTGLGAKTEDNDIASDGSRIFVTGGGSETYNMTDTVIENGDRFAYSFVIVGRSLGLTAALAYMDGGDVMVISNSMNYVSGGTTPFLVSGAYTINSSTAPEAVGKTIGLILIDNNDGSSAVQIDEVRLFTDDTQPTEDPVFTAVSSDGSLVTLSWTTEDLGKYSLQSKSTMASHTDWVTVYSNLPSGATTTNVPMSGDDQEFYRVISE